MELGNCSAVLSTLSESELFFGTPLALLAASTAYRFASLAFCPAWDPAREEAVQLVRVFTYLLKVSKFRGIDSKFSREDDQNEVEGGFENRHGFCMCIGQKAAGRNEKGVQAGTDLEGASS